MRLFERYRESTKGCSVVGKSGALARMSEISDCNGLAPEPFVDTTLSGRRQLSLGKHQ